VIGKEGMYSLIYIDPTRSRRLGSDRARYSSRYSIHLARKVDAPAASEEFYIEMRALAIDFIACRLIQS